MKDCYLDVSFDLAVSQATGDNQVLEEGFGDRRSLRAMGVAGVLGGVGYATVGMAAAAVTPITAALTLGALSLAATGGILGTFEELFEDNMIRRNFEKDIPNFNGRVKEVSRLIKSVKTGGDPGAVVTKLGSIRRDIDKAIREYQNMDTQGFLIRFGSRAAAEDRLKERYIEKLQEFAKSFDTISGAMMKKLEKLSAG